MARPKQITFAELERIIKYHEAGWSYASIGMKFGISGVAIRKYITGETKFDESKEGDNVQ